MDREQVFSLLDGAGISCRTVFHPPVYSMADLDALPELAAEKSRIAKNLFLKGREKYLYVARAEGRADLRALGEKLSSPRAALRLRKGTFGDVRGEQGRADALLRPVSRSAGDRRACRRIFRGRGDRRTSVRQCGDGFSERGRPFRAACGTRRPGAPPLTLLRKKYMKE